MKSLNIIVMGGGAAGFFGAITCAETFPKARVSILEKGAHVLTKVRISGGGRCNVTNACFDPKKLIENYPRGGQALLGPFHSFQPRDTVAWFESRQVSLKTEADNRIFPTTDTSFTIINALKEAAFHAGVRVQTNTGSIAITSRGPNHFLLTLKSGETMECDRLLLATGSAPDVQFMAQSLGHSLVPSVPSLFTFTIPDERLIGLAGVAVENARVELVDTPFEQTGPVLITHWGLSGPAILKLSSWGARALFEKNYQAPLRINWCGQTAKDVMQELSGFKTAHAKKLIGANPLYQLPKRLWERFIKTAHISPAQRWADLSKAQMTKISDVLTASVFMIRGKSTFKEEFVTCGGINLNEVNFKTMESRIHPGLYFAGEILDIDGVTGGFNFQSAWTTSRLAGLAMGK